MVVKYYYGDWVFTRYEEYEKLEAENKQLREMLGGVRSAINNNFPHLALEMIEDALKGGGE